MRALLTLATLTLAANAAAQPIDRTDVLVAAVRPALPFPDADVRGELPAQGGEKAKWFVIWPARQGEGRVTVRANPLHPDTQALSTPAMAEIQHAVVAAERKAQAAYDRAIEELKRTGKATSLDGVTLDDEGVAGERIDAELELTIGVEGAASFEIGSSRPPAVTSGSGGVTWVISTPPNIYRDAADSREHFRAAEVRLLFGTIDRPVVSRRDDDHRFAVTVTPDASAFTVVLRGNQLLLNEVVAKADWSRLARSTP